MARELLGKRIAILATDRFEEAELAEPHRALLEAGADAADVIAPHSGSIQGMNHDEVGHKIPVDRTLDEARPEDYDALVLPGGVANPDQLRTEPDAVRFVKDFFEAGTPVAVICHGPWTLVEAGVLDGRMITSWPSVRTDIENAGGQWLDEEVVVCENGPNTLVSSRKPDDLPLFTDRLVEVFAR